MVVSSRPDHLPRTDASLTISPEGLFDIAGASAAREVADLAARRRDLEAALRATAHRERNFAAAAQSEPETAAHLRLLADQGWTVLHDRRWPGSTRSNVDHLVIGYGGVAVIDTKNWSQPVAVRNERLWCGDDDRHDEVEKILALAAAIDDLLLEVTESSPGHAVGLSAVHVVPVLAFTRHDHARVPNPRVGRVLLTAAQHLPVLLARRPRILDPHQVGLIAEYLKREMPPTVVAPVQADHGTPSTRPDPDAGAQRPVGGQPADEPEQVGDQPQRLAGGQVAAAPDQQQQREPQQQHAARDRGQGAEQVHGPSLPCGRDPGPNPPGRPGSRRRLGGVPESVPLKVQVVAQTQFTPPADVPWETDASGGQALAEFAGRACYESWSKPNPATATNAGYLRHLLEVGHLAVLEHGTVTMYLTGLSRSLSHELVRHRHFSFSQLSQRYTPERDAELVEPALIAEDPEQHARNAASTAAALAAHDQLLAALEQRVADQPNPTLRRRQARQAARSVLPHASETRIVMTGNYRAWRHFVAMRASEHADAEIRELAVACLRELQRVAGNVFGDFRLSTLADGSEVAASPLAGEG